MHTLRLGIGITFGWLGVCFLTVAAPPAPDESAVAEHPVLTPTEASAAFQLPKGFEIRLVAAEPDLVNPMTMTLDERGNIYASLAHTYRYGAEGAPVDNPTNPVVRLELDARGRVVNRTEVVSGFTDPVMGIAVRRGRLWATNLNRVLTAELDDDGHALRQQVIVQDAETPWNPFGMYRVAFGPDGLLYLCVGDHPTRLSGRTNKVAVRGNTGAVFRFRPDGSEIERLVQGMRAPFAFHFDPFGRMWVLSNGEGNPNRLIDAIPGADYHFQTRAVDWSWLAGDDPLAPPVFENPPGAHTAVIAYYSSAFPLSYWGNLLVSNWGAHGFPSANHVILRHRLDTKGNVIKTEPFLTTSDPRFRPTQMMVAPDGNLYVLDWYGMDDDNDLTGRLYKISYVGDEPTPRTTMPGIKLANANQWTRRQASRQLIASGPSAGDVLEQYLSRPDALGAAEALWTLSQCTWSRAPSIMELGLEHPDGRVRRLAVALLHERKESTKSIRRLLDDPDPTVRVEAAIACLSQDTGLGAVVNALKTGAASSSRLRYRAALAIARGGKEEDFELLLRDTDTCVQQAGLIALDEAFHERVQAEAARNVLGKLIVESNGSLLNELLAIGQRWPHASLRRPVIAALNRDIPATPVFRGLSMLERLGLSLKDERVNRLLSRFWKRLASGELRLADSEEKLGALRILTSGQVWPDVIVVWGRLLRDTRPEVRAEAHRVLTTIGIGNSACVNLCRSLIKDTSAALGYRLETIVSLSKIELKLSVPFWSELLNSPQPLTTLVAVRSLRSHADHDAVRQLFAEAEPRIVARGPTIAAALLTRDRSSDAVHAAPSEPSLLPAKQDSQQATQLKAALRQRLIEHHTDGNAMLGRLVFRSQVCRICHQPRGGSVCSGPPLEGVAATNTVEYLVDSIIYPSKVIKTGFMMEEVLTNNGRVLVGGVVVQGRELVVTSAAGTTDRIKLSDVDQRRRLNLSPMPDALDTTVSEPELLDLIAYLLTLRE